jgi:hypothetical protein
MDALVIQPWDLVWSDVTNYDRAVLHTTVTETFAGLEKQLGPLVEADKPLTRNGQLIPPKPRWALSEGAEYTRVRDPLNERLRALFPNWYGRDVWYVGNETFGGCFCHSLPSALTSGHSAGADWVVTEIESMLTVLRAWAPIIEHAEFAEKSARTKSIASKSVLAMIDVMIDHGFLSESWYRYVDDGVRWLVASTTGRALDEPALRDFCSRNFAFTSWTAPSNANKRSFADAAAELVDFAAPTG